MQFDLVIASSKPAKTELRTSSERAIVKRANEYLDVRADSEQRKSQSFECSIKYDYYSDEVKWNFIQDLKWFINTIIDFKQIEGSIFFWSWKVEALRVDSKIAGCRREAT